MAASTLHYNDRAGGTVLARYRVTADDATVLDPNSQQVLLTLPQPFPNHNGGHIDFGDDGYLYLALGDGGSANDPLLTGQNPNDLLGSILRLDVSTDDASYDIPADNPFVDGGGAAEVWSYGLRNPWRFSFDRATGDMYIGDVGQNQIEEVDFEPADSPGGVNYGWNGYEGLNVFANNQISQDVVFPIAQYSHGVDGCSITGGYVYRGEAIPQLQGYYLYSDYCSGNIWAAWRDATGTWSSQIVMQPGLSVVSFGEDAAGELYILDYSGRIFRLDPTNA